MIYLIVALALALTAAGALAIGFIRQRRGIAAMSARMQELRRAGDVRQGPEGTYLAHTLNNTCVAPPRMLIAFLENNLNEDGSIRSLKH